MKLGKYFLTSGSCALVPLVSLITFFGFSSAVAKAPVPVPVSALKLSVQDEQALRTVALSHEMEKTKEVKEAKEIKETEKTKETKTVAHWVWRENPLHLTLPLNQEKQLSFPEPVQVDVNGQLTTDQLRIINDHHRVYLTALKPFPQKIRLYVTLKKSGHIIFLDMDTPDSSETVSTPADSIEIAVAANPQKENSPMMQTPLAYEPFSSFSTSADQWVHLLRWAWQQLYAPNYLLSNDASILRLPMRTQFWVSGLFYSDTVFAHPLASWVQGENIVTAVELRNAYPHPVALDVAHDLCGHWNAALLYPHYQLEPAGHPPGDDTTLFLISDQPFEQALRGCAHVRV